MNQSTISPGTVFWDFDGTLASRPNMWMSACLEALNQVAPTHGIHISKLKKGLSWGLPWHTPEKSYEHIKVPSAWWAHVSNHFHTILQRLGVQADMEQITKLIRESITDATRYTLFDDVTPALDRLADKGWRQIIVSNHIPELADIVTGLGLHAYFTEILSSARVGYEKPNPKIFKTALNLALPDRPVWMIGDSERADCLPAQNLGIKAILVRRTMSEFEPKTEGIIEAVDIISTV